MNQSCENNPTMFYFEIQSANPEAGCRFYEEVFGWKFTFTHGLPVKYWRMEAGSFRGGLLERPANTPPVGCGTNAFVCSFEVDDIDETERKILASGGRVALPKFAVIGMGWHAYYMDPDHNTFGIFQPDPNAG